MLRASRPHNKAVGDGGVTAGVAAMARAIDGGGNDVGTILDASRTDRGRGTEEVASELLFGAGEGQKEGKNKKLTRKEKAVEVAAEIRERGGVPQELLFHGKGKRRRGRGTPGVARDGGNSGAVAHIVENAVVGTPNVENAVVGTPNVEKAVVGTPNVEKAVVGSPNVEKAVVGSPNVEKAVVGTPNVEKAVVGTPNVDETSAGGATDLRRHFGQPGLGIQLTRPVLPSGESVTGANKRQWKKVTKRRRRDLQMEQRVESYWTAHDASFTDQLCRKGPSNYRGGMCPSNLALHHPAADLLNSFPGNGAYTYATKDKVNLGTGK